MDHNQASAGIRHRKDLQCNSILIISGEEQPIRLRRIIWRTLLESQAAMGEDEANLLIADTVLPCRLDDLDTQADPP
jgi:hypothetical protein